MGDRPVDLRGQRRSRTVQWRTCGWTSPRSRIEAPSATNAISRTRSSSRRAHGESVFTSGPGGPRRVPQRYRFDRWLPRFQRHDREPGSLPPRQPSSLGPKGVAGGMTDWQLSAGPEMVVEATEGRVGPPPGRPPGAAIRCRSRTATRRSTTRAADDGLLGGRSSLPSGGRRRRHATLRRPPQDRRPLLGARAMGAISCGGASAPVSRRKPVPQDSLTGSRRCSTG